MEVKYEGSSWSDSVSEAERGSSWYLRSEKRLDCRRFRSCSVSSASAAAAAAAASLTCRIVFATSKGWASKTLVYFQTA